MTPLEDSLDGRQAEVTNTAAPDFENDHWTRSSFVRLLTLQELDGINRAPAQDSGAIPSTFVQYWHDSSAIPPDVRECMESWSPLQAHGVSMHVFDDVSGRRYIAENFGAREVTAFDRCRHPAMRSDFFRMCFLVAEGGLYVDTDDVLCSAGWTELFARNTLKVQPLCYDIDAGAMLPAGDIRQSNLSTENRIFYVNNNPLAAPAGHPILQRALVRSIDILLGADRKTEIQSTTGPGNLTVSLAAHAHDLQMGGETPDFEILVDWDSIADTRWNLGYRNDCRNWRNMDRT